MVCIFGAIGDCGNKIKSVSETFQTTVQRNIADTLVNISHSSNLVTATNQTLRIGNITCGGNLRIAGITQKTVSRVNLQKLSEVVDSSKLRDILTNAVKNTAEKNLDVKTGFLSTGSDVSDINRVYNNNINEVVNNYTYNNFQNSITKADVSQQMIVGGAGGRIEMDGDCDFGAISQEISLEVIASDAAKSLTDRFRDLMLKNQAELESKTTTKVESTGPIQEVGDIVDDVTDTVALPFYVALGIIGLIFFIVFALIIYYVFVPAAPPAQEVN